MLKKGLEKLGLRGEQAADKEIQQLHERNCFSPLNVNEIIPEEKAKVVEALMLLQEKRDKSIKGRCVYNGKPTCDWLTREDTASPTVALESVMLTAAVDAKEERDVMTSDVPNAYIQTIIPHMEKGQERIIMKIKGRLVDMLVQLAPEVYADYVVYEKGVKVLYVQVLRALYGMLVATLLWYKKFRSDLEEVGFVFNPYDPCVANRTERNKQHTIRFHVDDIMSSHKDKVVNDEFHKWLDKKYGKYKKVKVTRGKIHDYLGMTFDFSEKGKVQVDMSDYIESMVNDFSVDFTEADKAATPAAEDLFNVDESELLDKKRKEEFHTFVAKSLFVCKRARPDIHTATAALTTRVKQPNESDWNKLIRLLKYCNGTKEDKLILTIDNLHVIKWFVDVSFVVHPDFCSHTSGTMIYDKSVL